MFSYCCVVTLPDDRVESQPYLDVKAAQQAFAEALSEGHTPCYVRRFGRGGVANRVVAHSNWTTEANTSSFLEDIRFRGESVPDAWPRK